MTETARKAARQPGRKRRPRTEHRQRPQSRNPSAPMTPDPQPADAASRAQPADAEPRPEKGTAAPADRRSAEAGTAPKPEGSGSRDAATASQRGDTSAATQRQTATEPRTDGSSSGDGSAAKGAVAEVHEVPDAEASRAANRPASPQPSGARPPAGPDRASARKGTTASAATAAPGSHEGAGHPAEAASRTSRVGSPAGRGKASAVGVPVKAVLAKPELPGTVARNSRGGRATGAPGRSDVPDAGPGGGTGGLLAKHVARASAQRQSAVPRRGVTGGANAERTEDAASATHLTPRAECPSRPARSVEGAGEAASTNTAKAPRVWPTVRRAGAAGAQRARRTWRRRPRGAAPAAACVLAGVLAGAAYGALAPARYTATSYVAVVPGKGGDPVTALGFAQAYGRIATDTAVLAKAQQDGGVPVATLQEGVEAVTSPDAPMIEITGSAPSAGEAAEMANAVARSLADVAGESAKDTGVELTAFSRARAPREASSPSPVLATAVGGSAGVLVGALVLLVRPRRDAAAPDGEETVR
ncbi:hypothetical protein E4198_03090 [Streptomyces sp. RKND-216]|uniref:hypothetical protein n=1 Tax=Streptomyces sp. RKND-216 TaxID=2562581 RepID=UPI00109DF73D|nr:hypothetical protein [Streptomyces sp. RKND-216]THA23848.1 hypothetical protein E4198_03090 [Streptomyces sp. RKND-216]